LADFFKSSPPKALGQINRNLVGSISVYYNGEAILEMNQSETRIACGGHVC
jgi:hypothetical protein